jgi:hypothetical protein
MITIHGIKFYSVDETATILGMSKKRLYNWNVDAEANGVKHSLVLHPVTAPNGRKFFREKEIITVLSQCWGIEVGPQELSDTRSLVPA